MDLARHLNIYHPLHHIILVLIIKDSPHSVAMLPFNPGPVTFFETTWTFSNSLNSDMAGVPLVDRRLTTAGPIDDEKWALGYSVTLLQLNRLQQGRLCSSDRCSIIYKGAAWVVPDMPASQAEIVLDLSSQASFKCAKLTRYPVNTLEEATHDDSPSQAQPMISVLPTAFSIYGPIYNRGRWIKRAAAVTSKVGIKGDLCIVIDVPCFIVQIMYKTRFLRLGWQFWYML